MSEVYVVILDAIPPTLHRVIKKLPGVIARSGKIIVCTDRLSMTVIAERAGRAMVIVAEQCSVQQFVSNPVSREIAALYSRRGRPRKRDRR